MINSEPRVVSFIHPAAYLNEAVMPDIGREKKEEAEEKRDGHADENNILPRACGLDRQPIDCNWLEPKRDARLRDKTNSIEVPLSLLWVRLKRANSAPKQIEFLVCRARGQMEMAQLVANECAKVSRSAPSCCCCCC